MKTKYLFATVLLAVSTSLSAQNSVTVSGRLMGQSYFDITDMYRLSQNGFTTSTARSSAMGRAFTSLGADLASMSINPAGLGMYQSSEFGITQAITVSKTNTDRLGSQSAVFGQDKSTNTKYNLDNIGLAIHAFESTGTLTSITVGFGYNKMANFNSLSSFGLAGERTTIGEVFTNMLYDLQGSGITQQMMNSSSKPFENSRIPVSDWGAILAYQTEFVFGEDFGDNPRPEFTLDNAISADATVNPYLRTRTRGGIDEYTLSAGFNIRDFLYLGATIGMQSIRYDEKNYYDETYNDNTVEYPLYNLLYDQSARITGSGVNFKLGAIIRPVGGLRIGVAFHTPTWISLNKSYYASMRAIFSDVDNVKHSGTNTYEYSFRTPARLLVGASYTFGQFAILSVDYQRTWYNGMRLSDAAQRVEDDYKAQVKSVYRPANNVSAGVEVKPMPMLSLRLGGSWQQSGFKNENTILDRYDSPISGQTYNITAGLGLRMGSCSLDFSYVYCHTEYTPFDLYFYRMNDEDPLALSSYFKQTLKRHVATLSFGVRF